VEQSPRRNSDTAYRAIGDEGGLVVQATASAVQVLNPVGSTIFALLDGQHSVAQIVEAVVREYDVSEEVARRDVGVFLDELAEKGLLEEVSDGANG